MGDELLPLALAVLAILLPLLLGWAIVCLPERRRKRRRMAKAPRR